MRFWSVLFTGLLMLASLAPFAVANDECSDDQCPSGEGDDPGASNGQGNGKGPKNGTQGNATGNTTSETDGSDGPGKGPSAREKEIEERKKQAREAWRTGQSQADRAQADQQAALIDQLPEHLRDRVGRLMADESAVDGTFVTFQPDRQLGLLQDVTRSGTLLFDEVVMPLDFAETASGTVSGKTYRLTGEDWSFRLIDDAAVPLKFETSGEAFLLVLPADATVTPVANGLQVTYPTGPDTGLIARVTGDVAVDPAEPKTLRVTGTAKYHVSAERPLLPQVSNQVRDSLEAALDGGRLGAEATVLRASGSATFVDSVLYDDMDVVLEESTVVSEGHTFSGYTITVDSESHEGKTIAVAFESGLLDPENLIFRYFNVETDQTVEATIVQARDLNDVLDPHDDGTVAEYWIVEDADGVQVLLSIPNFSVHQIQLLGLVDLVLERPSLLIGTVGAIVLVAVATGGLFRRPEDEA